MSGNSAGASLTYNAKNQTTAMTYGGQTLSPLVYADVDQTERTQVGSTTFASSPLGVQIAKVGTSLTYYTRDNKGNLIGERLPGGVRWYYLKDGLGSVVAVVSQSGSLGNRYGYDPYGKVTTSSGSVANPWGYAGGYLDLTSLVKFGARYYDPNLGRWTQQDAAAGRLGNPGTVNRYNYVGCNPVNGTDPTGGDWGTCIAGAAIGTIGSAIGFVGVAYDLLPAVGELLAATTLEEVTVAGVFGAAAFGGLAFVGLGIAAVGIGIWASYQCWQW